MDSNANRESTTRLPENIILAAVITQVLSHSSHAPFWLMCFVSFLAVARYALRRKARRAIPKYIRLLCVVVSALFFFLDYKTNFSVDMAASFLLLAGSLKLLEVEKEKDLRGFIYIMLYVAATSFLFDQGVAQAAIQVLMVIFCLSGLLFVSVGGDSRGRMRSGSLLMRVAFLSIPIVIVSFLFFPRIAPLWSIPFKTQIARTGISDSMSPGDIVELTKSTKRAFRVSFSKAVPDNADLYWRGLVLDHFDGHTWRTAQFGGGRSRAARIDNGVFYDRGSDYYSLMLEPHQERWVFSLNGSVASSSNVESGDMGLLRLKTDAIQATQVKLALPTRDKYRVLDIPTAVQLSDRERRYSRVEQDLQLPPRATNPKTQAYVASLLQAYPNPSRLLTHLLEVFSQKSFYYTLKPLALTENFVDDFLFSTKQGFCAHYAGSLAYMLRLANIPSRVVVGYQGGEYNDDSDYLIVHQYDAHAWVEAKLPKLGWVRVDPTGMVSPERILNGLEDAVSSEDSFLAGSPFAAAALKIGVINWLRLRTDELNFKWQKWVVNYNQDDQYSLVKSVLGEFSLVGISLVFVYLFIAMFVMMWLYYLFESTSGKYTPAERKYMIWGWFLSKLGYARLPGETPRAFLVRIKDVAPSKLVSVTERQTKKLERDEYNNVQ